MTEPSLAELGLRAGDRVRWRPRPDARWVEGRVTGRERDGSVAVRDGHGRARSLRTERLEVEASGPRGARTWERVDERAARSEQLDLFG